MLSIRFLISISYAYLTNDIGVDKREDFTCPLDRGAVFQVDARSPFKTHPQAGVKLTPLMWWVTSNTPLTLDADTA